MEFPIQNVLRPTLLFNTIQHYKAGTPDGAYKHILHLVNY